MSIFIAAMLGGAIGLEREYRSKEAGFRTHFLVGLGSALFMVLSNEYSYVDVYLKENNDQFVGINGNLNELKDHVRVKGTDTTTSEEFAYEFEQITNN